MSDVDKALALKLDGHEDRLQRAEDKYTELKAEVAAHGERIDHLRERMDDQMEAVQDRVGELRQEFSHGMERIEELLQPIVASVQKHSEAITAIEADRQQARKVMGWVLKGLGTLVMAAVLAYCGLG